jgi:lipoprotein-anchoring transpeptidase ErfK/SrfK
MAWGVRFVPAEGHKETAMRWMSNQNAAAAKTRGTALAAAMLLAAAEALAQEKQADHARLAEPTAKQPHSLGVRRILVSIADRKLALLQDGRVLKTYAVAVGADVSPSPSGEFKIVHRIANPTYYAPGVVIPPGKANPLGTRWLGLNQKGYGIHGTNQPGSIGRRASHGCIRMRNRDIEELFELVRAGDGVELHAERTAELAEVFGAAERGVAVASAAAPAAAAEVGLN